MDFNLIMFSLVILILGVSVGVAFLTLLERKLLCYIRIRKGPNEVGFLGTLQPTSDALKLFSKEQSIPLMSCYWIYYFSPIFNLTLSLFLWMIMPFWLGFLSFNYSILFIFWFLKLAVNSVMMSGWSSNSNYSLLGSLHSVAQMISYEVIIMFLIILSFMILTLFLNLIGFYFYQEFLWFILSTFPLCYMWLVSSWAETNRTPFDSAEGESELVSGYNMEYKSSVFALIFLAVYSSILFMSLITVILFMGANFDSYSLFIKVVMLSFFWIWVRGTLPRFRYDNLIYLSWKVYLPVSLNLFMLFLGLKCYILTLMF